jgi:hypothetical protein
MVVEFEFAHLLDPVGEVQQHQSQSVAVKTPPSEVSAGVGLLPSESMPDLLHDDTAGRDPDEDVMVLLCPWLPEDDASTRLSAVAGPAPDQAPGFDAVDSLLAELVDTESDDAGGLLSTQAFQSAGPGAGVGGAAGYSSGNGLETGAGSVAQDGPPAFAAARDTAAPGMKPRPAGKPVEGTARQANDGRPRSRFAERGLNDDLLPSRDRRGRR